MSDYPKRFIVQNDTVTVSEELHQTLNLLADRNYQLMGYVSQPNQDYSKSNHPQELMCYQNGVRGCLHPTANGWAG